MSFSLPVSHPAYIHPEGLKQLKICIQLIKHEAELYFESGTISCFFLILAPFPFEVRCFQISLNVLEIHSMMSKELLYWHSQAEIWGDPEAKGHSDRITEFLSFSMGGWPEGSQRKTMPASTSKRHVKDSEPEAKKWLKWEWSYWPLMLNITQTSEMYLLLTVCVAVQMDGDVRDLSYFICNNFVLT